MPYYLSQIETLDNLQLAKQIFFKLLNEISSNSQAKHLQLAKNMQKNLHISIIFTTFAADFEIL